MLKPKLFPETINNLEKHLRQLALPAAKTRYAMHFTPRSGSSWVGDIATQTKKLSQLGEPFNPPHVSVMAPRLNATDLNSFVDKLTRVRNTGGIFGFQITLGDIEQTFNGPHPFMQFFQKDPMFWLIREDIVLQAISLSKKAQTRIGHSTQVDQPRDAAAQYNAKEIMRFVKHIEYYEQGTEAMFKRYKITPLRISYERVTQLDPAEVAQLIARHIGRPDLTFAPPRTEHRKLGTSQNDEFAARFRQEHVGALKAVDAKRHEMIAKLAPLEHLKSAI